MTLPVQVSARFMGVDMERMVLDLQELLRLQYEGQVMPILLH